MSPEQVCKLLVDRFGPDVADAVLDSARPYVVVKADRWGEVARFLRDDSHLRLNFLRSITSLDLVAEDKLACVYDLLSVAPDLGEEMVTDALAFAVRVETDRAEPRIPSVASIWPAADWHEREAYDMMGVVFTGHPDLRRILCPEDWEGYPLRKDYEFPLEYHGIPGTTEHDLTNPYH